MQNLCNTYEHLQPEAFEIPSLGHYTRLWDVVLATPSEAITGTTIDFWKFSVAESTAVPGFPLLPLLQ